MIEALANVAGEVGPEVGVKGPEGVTNPIEKSGLEKFAETVDGDKSSGANWEDFDEEAAGKLEEQRGDLVRIDGQDTRSAEHVAVIQTDMSKGPEPSYALKPDADGRIQTRNDGIKDQTHPETGVPFKEKTVTDAEGNEVTGVFPEFESELDVQLPEDLEQASDKEQFDECNRQLKEKVENDPEFAKQFTPEQLEQIKNGDTPDGYTWHHNEEKGKMQLVDSETHAKTGHTGGKVIWGGGSENR
jgi:hypothetical protein